MQLGQLAWNVSPLSGSLPFPRVEADHAPPGRISSQACKLAVLSSRSLQRPQQRQAGLYLLLLLRQHLAHATQLLRGHLRRQAHITHV